MLFIVVIVLQYSQNIPLNSEPFVVGGWGRLFRGGGVSPVTYISVDSCKTHP